MPDKAVLEKTLDRYESGDFLPFLNQVFTIRLDGTEEITLELVSVMEASQSSRPGARRPFSLQFLGPTSSQYLIQHIYHLENEQIGTLDLFIVPLGLENRRMRYEAVFT
jgi:hypothetical protein